MKESVLRAAVEERRPSTTEGTWKYLDDLGFLWEAVNEDGKAEDDPVGYLIGKIDKIWAAGPEHNARDIPDGGRIPDSTMFDFDFLTPYEQELVQARSEALAADAAADESVQKFRDRFTGGVPLDLPRAGAFVNSPAAANLPISWFEENGVPFVDHDARMVTVDRRGRCEVVEFQVDPPGITLRIELERGREAPEYGDRCCALSALVAPSSPRSPCSSGSGPP